MEPLNWQVVELPLNDAIATLIPSAPFTIDKVEAGGPPGISVSRLNASEPSLVPTTWDGR